MTAVERSRFTPPRIVATGRECWWTLGRNIRDRWRDAGDRGLCDVSDLGGGRCALVLKDGSRWAAPSLEWRVDWSLSINVGPVIHHRGVVRLDVLCEHPPFLPTPTDWQQITRRGERTHPGHDMTNWSYDNPW